MGEPKKFIFDMEFKTQGYDNAREHRRHCH